MEIRGRSTSSVITRMQLKTFALITWLFLFSCTRSNRTIREYAYDQFEFSYNDFFHQAYTIKFSQSDSVLMRQYFASSLFNNLKSQTSYWAQLSAFDKLQLDSVLSAINLFDFDSSYYEDYEDGSEFQFFIRKDTMQKLIYVRSHFPPKELELLNTLLGDFKDSLMFSPIDTVWRFESANKFHPPPILIPAEKFVTPKVE